MISVAVFAFFGGILRAAFSNWVGGIWGTILVNLFGSFLLTFLTYYVIKRHLLTDWLNAGMGTGFIGAFTTFGTFSTTTIKLFQTSPINGWWFMAINLIGGLMMALGGFGLVNKLTAKRGKTSE